MERLVNAIERSLRIHFAHDREDAMKKLTLQLPVFGFIVATRAALGFGAGLLLSGRIPEPRRRMIGMALVAIGAATTAPAIITIARHTSE
jgi:hypothetical protein